MAHDFATSGTVRWLFLDRMPPTRSADLLALAERLNSRQDMSFFRRTKHQDLIRDVFGDSAVEAARASVADLSVEECALAAIDLVHTIQHDREPLAQSHPDAI